ncbi:putative 3'-hydroxy-N-methyl-(S)-coclaurine 4'-O-methyltransferase-like [Capsicum annuum]|nr:putative 3'-hydroxy-N-methyl-(S)-coclaurine 4'-O-methyltransferase-like [Capsicum annuum]
MISILISDWSNIWYQDGGRLSDQQMALLQYQQENIHFLSEEILRLQETLSKYERSNDGSAPQVDPAHLLATRDQELRTLKAEMNQLQSELRFARSIIEEKDVEIQRILNANNEYLGSGLIMPFPSKIFSLKQYVEENARLRAILGEWSNRAAKVVLHYLCYIAMMFIVHLSSITPNVFLGCLKARTCIRAGTDVKLGTAEKNDHTEDSNA